MPTSRRPQKRCSSSPGLARPHPLVAPGDPPRRRPARPAAHPACPHHRLVMLATRPPSQCTTFASEATNATVMLAPSQQSASGPLADERSTARLLLELEEAREAGERWRLAAEEARLEAA